MIHSNNRKWLALTGISILCLIIFIDITIVSTCLPTIQRDLGAQVPELQWIVNIVYLFIVALMATMGRVGDLLGRRKIFYAGMVLLALASLGAGFANGISTLIFFRALQGLALATLPVAAALVMSHFPEEQHAKAMGIFAGVSGTGLAIGPLLGGLFAQTIGWRWIFFVNIPVILIGFVICLMAVQESKSEDKVKIDWGGAFALFAGLGALTLLLIEGDVWGWGSIPTLLVAVAAIVFLLLFVKIEKTVETPLLDLKLLVNRWFFPASLAVFACGCFIALLLFLLPLFLQNVQDYSSIATGWVMFALALTVVLVAPCAGVINDYIGTRRAICFMVFCLVASAIIHFFIGVNASEVLVVMALVPFGIAWGFANVSPTVAVTAAVPAKDAGVAMGALWTLFNFGAVIGLAVGGLIFRLQEKASMHMLLVNGHINLGLNEKQALSTLLVDPSQLGSVTKEFPMDTSQFITGIFQHAFMSGFQASVVFLGIVALIAFAVALRVLPKQ